MSRNLEAQRAEETGEPFPIAAYTAEQVLAQQSGKTDFLQAVAERALLATRPEHHADRAQEVYRLSRDPKTFEVTVESDVTLEDFKQVMSPEDWDFLEQQVAPLRGSTWAFINPTMEGGGVAMMRPPLVHLMRLFGVDAHWYVMEPLPEEEQETRGDPFVFTKQMHNVSQRMTDHRITQEGKELHWYWADEFNGPVIKQQLKELGPEFVVVDDPQPAPLIRDIKALGAKLLWRNHIDVDHDLMADKTTPPGEVSDYLLYECGVSEADAILAHPVLSFIHPGMEDKTYFAPATFDHFDNLNRHLSEEEVIEGIEFINAEITAKNAELIAIGRHMDVQPLLSLDPHKKRLTLIARFDPSKAMEKAIEMGAMTRKLLRDQGVAEADLPEIVILGNGSVDDPDGPTMYEEMLKVRKAAYSEADGITVVRVKHNYDAVNALMSRSTIVMQTSYREGMETRISDAIKHGKPVVIANRGGMPTQVVPGESGLILDYNREDYDLPRGAEWMAHLLTDDAAYARIVESTKKQAQLLNLPNFTTPSNLARLARVARHLRMPVPPKADKLWKMEDMIAAAASESEELEDLVV